jgi:hypothetical protein
VNGGVATLYGQVWQADAEPTAAQLEAAASTEHDSADVMKRWEQLKGTDLATLNQALGAAGLPALKIDVDLHRDEGAMDEE